MAEYKTFKKKRHNSPKITICLFCTIVTHGVHTHSGDGVPPKNKITYYRLNNDWMGKRVLKLIRAELWVFFTKKLRMLIDWTPSHISCFFWIKLCACIS